MGFIEGMTKRCEEHKAMKRTKKIKESREPSDHVELGSQFSLVQAWEIALINEILGTKDGDKYLLELYPPHLEFFQRLNKTQSYLESSTDDNSHRKLQMVVRAFRVHPQASRLPFQRGKVGCNKNSETGCVTPHKLRNLEVYQSGLQLHGQDSRQGDPLRRVPILLLQTTQVLQGSVHTQTIIAG